MLVHPGRASLAIRATQERSGLRFSLYYFFSFGGFVALALWLPRYLVGVYGFDIGDRGMIAAAYSIPAASFAPMAALCRTSSGPQIMYAMFAVSAVATAFSRYPQVGPAVRMPIL